MADQRVARKSLGGRNDLFFGRRTETRMSMLHVVHIDSRRRRCRFMNL